jgi:hypothetical protein
MADQERLEVRQGVEPITTARDIVDVVRHAMEALQPAPKYPSDDKQLMFDELASVLAFFGEDE